MTAPHFAQSSEASFRDVAHAVQWVEGVRQRLARVVLTRWLFIASALVFSLLAVLAVVSHLVALPRAVVLFALIIGLAGIVAGTLLAVRRRTISTLRAALWIEEQLPLHYGVVTLIEQRVASGADHGRGRTQDHSPAAAATVLDQLLGAVNRDIAVLGDAHARIHRRLADMARNRWRAPGVAALTVGVAVIVSAVTLAARASGAASGERALSVQGLLRGAAAVIPVAPEWRVVVRPPAYTGRPMVTLDDAEVVQGIEGSQLRVSFGDSARLLSMPERAGTVEVTFGDARRLLALVPQPDSLPAVTLLSPVADSVYRDTTSRVELAARATDDFGLASMVFDVIVTSGEGERYDARRLSLGTRALQGAVRAEHTHALSFADLGLAPGDIVHVRAVAYDRNPRSGRGPGVSETRSFRIARASEYDSVAVEGAPPPPVDSSLMSQRMLLLLTERLQRQRPQLPQPVLVRESRKLALDQARLRRAVSAVVFQRFGSEAEAEHVHYEGDGHEHGVAIVGGRMVESSTESARAGGDTDAAIIAVNRPLLEAYNAMWDAGRELELAEPGAAIPHMQRALDAIQRARAAERLYLRGRVRPVVVDLARVRLAGRDTGQNSTRSAVSAEESARARLDARLLQAAVQYVEGGRTNVLRDSLFVLRVEMLSVAPEAASSLGKVLEVLTISATAPASSLESERMTSVTDLLVQARRALRPIAEYRGGVTAWSVP